MATAAMTQKPSNKNPQPENPNKNVAPNPTDIGNPNRTHEANPSIQSEPSTDDFGRETAKRNGDDSRAKGIQSTAGATVVSPMVGSGQAADVQKKLRRAERFGVPVQLSEEEKRNSRAERFGTGSGSSGATKTLEEGKRKARAERFGIPVQSVVDEDAKKKARLSRFAPVTKIDNLEEEKRKAREMRFSQPASGSKLYVNGKGNLVPKIAIAGKALGGA